jgi:hydroxymethylpyrimidine kinase/phosphomethylpyrimidine kinase/thiamine-phosphate diphosphorylase
MTHDAASSTPPVIWSIAGIDTSGGAGLSADQRAADALGVHLCPVVAALTAQHSQGVQAVIPVSPAQLQSQLRALADDLTPRVIKTGMLGSVAAIELVAQWVDRLREGTPPGADPHRHLALVVDPVLGASSGGAAFSNDSIVAAYRTLLLPRATVLTPNLAEARRLLCLPTWHDDASSETPALARDLHGLGARSVVVTGGDSLDASTTSAPHCLDWIATPQTQGWLTAPRVDTPHTHGTGCTFASGVAAAMALGHVEADAIALAKMLTHHALSHGHAAGGGPGPVLARAGFAAGPRAGGAPLPWLGLGEDLPWRLTTRRDPASDDAAPLFGPFMPPADGLYGITPDSHLLRAALEAGLRCVQLRHKARDGLAAHLAASLQDAIERGALLFVNDHWRDTLAALSAMAPTPPGTIGIHLGQEDLLALSADERAALLTARHRLMLGLSSHSLWELARAAGCGASLIACGPVRPTTTKHMPWRPQGEHNLRWWVAHSPVPVVAIGGLLNADDLPRVAACGPAALCVVRALQGPPELLGAHLATLRQAVQDGRSRASRADSRTGDHVSLPTPVLPIENAHAQT